MHPGGFQCTGQIGSKLNPPSSSLHLHLHLGLRTARQIEGERGRRGEVELVFIKNNGLGEVHLFCNLIFICSAVCRLVIMRASELDANLTRCHRTAVPMVEVGSGMVTDNILYFHILN